MKKRLAKAVYVINKEAKKIRDIRRILKEHLFINKRVIIPVEMETFVEERKIRGCLETDFSIDLSGLICAYDFNGIKDLLSIQKEYEERKYYYEMCRDEPDHSLEENELWQEEDEHDYQIITSAINKWESFKDIKSFGHEFLTDTKKELQRIYRLKSFLILDVLHLPIQEVHLFIGDDNNLYPYYTYGGFGFHLQLPQSGAGKLTMEAKGTKTIDGEISSITASDITMSYDEALECIRDFLERECWNDWDPKNVYKSKAYRYDEDYEWDYEETD